MRDTFRRLAGLWPILTGHDRIALSYMSRLGWPARIAFRKRMIWGQVVEIRQLKYFIAVVDFGSISRASGQIGVTQPSLSQQVRNLEIEVGFPLLVRSTAGVETTAAGRRFYGEALEILRDLDEACIDARKIGQAERVSGLVTVGLPNSSAALLSYPLFHSIRKSYPGIQLRILEATSNQLLELLLHSRLDIALQFISQSMQGLAAMPLFTERLFLIENRRDPGPATIRAAELDGRQVVIPSLPNGMRKAIDAFCSAQGVTLEVIAEIDSLHALRQIAQSGDAAVILPWASVADLDPTDICIREISAPPFERSVSVCCREGAPRSAAMKVVIIELQAICATGVEAGKWRGIRLPTT